MCTFQVCVVDGVFEAVAREGEADFNVQASAQGVVFHPASHTVFIIYSCACKVQEKTGCRIQSADDHDDSLAGRKHGTHTVAFVLIGRVA